MVITTDRNLVKIHLLCGRDSINEIWLIVRQYRRWIGGTRLLISSPLNDHVVDDITEFYFVIDILLTMRKTEWTLDNACKQMSSTSSIDSSHPPHTSAHDGGTPTRAVTMASRACTTQKHASGSCIKQILMSTLTNHVLMWTQVNYNRRGIEDMNYGVSLTYAKNGPWKHSQWDRLESE